MNTGYDEKTEFVESFESGSEISKNYKIIDYAFGKFMVKVVLSDSDKFIGIQEISVNKDFRTFEQKLSSIGYHDLDIFYKED